MKVTKWILLSFIFLMGIGIITIYILELEYAYVPSIENVENSTRQNEMIAFDVWGQQITKQQVKKLKQTPRGRSFLSPENGAVEIDEGLLQLGRRVFYEETFGNEVFMTDILGLVNGALTIPKIMKAIIQLKGEGTTNLQVELAKDVTVGDKHFKKGTKINTGIDVPKGAYVPLGMPVSLREGRVKVGVSCAACHATVDPETKRIIEGAPNSDLNAGLLLALATNSAAYFTHAERNGLKQHLEKLDQLDRTIVTSNGKRQPLPDSEAIEKAVDETFVNWPPGNFDSTIDLKSNPAQIPDSFTLGDHPYGWSGFAAVGPFKGLSTFSQNVHAQNSDSLSQADASQALFGIDKEIYLGIILQNAANPKFRYEPNIEQKPSEFFATVDPTPDAPGVNELVSSPSSPKLSLIAPDGLFASSPGHLFWKQINGVAAWQNTLVPPKPKEHLDRESVALGKDVFIRAGCISCHAGAALTNNRIISAKVIGTEPSRAKALKKTENIFGESYMYPPNTPVPISKDARMLKVPTDTMDTQQIKLAYAHDDSPGGYKVPSLIGVYWTAPYLHDGGVAVGKDVNTQLGMAGTLMKGIPPDPANSLRALVDKNLREQVIQANRSSKRLQSVHVLGIGHEFWVDASTGFTPEEQDALIKYLQSLK